MYESELSERNDEKKCGVKKRESKTKKDTVEDGEGGNQSKGVNEERCRG